MENLSLRPATDADELFLEELFFDVRRDEFELTGLSPVQINALLAMQYTAQKQSYKMNFPNAEHSIIEFSGKKVGRLLVDFNPQSAHLVDIAVSRDFRGKGIGSYLLHKLKNENKTVTLTVFKTNFGAIRLYERHGFAVVSDMGSHLEMERKNVG